MVGMGLNTYTDNLIVILLEEMLSFIIIFIGSISLVGVIISFFCLFVFLRARVPFGFPAQRTTYREQLPFCVDFPH